MENSITFLGTAGARVMVANQIQASGGIWINLAGSQILLDPGPGSIVQSALLKMNPEQLSAIILSHRHLDHSGDMNIMVEAMTQGGFKPHGRVFLPADALDSEPVLFSYLKRYLEGVEILVEGKSYNVNDVNFTTPIKHIHGVETYGLKFSGGGYNFAYIADTRFFERIIEIYRADLIIINVVFMNKHFRVDHLSVEDVEVIVKGIKPKVALLTHFGLQVWNARPGDVAQGLSQKTGTRVIAAADGMKFDLKELKEQ